MIGAWALLLAATAPTAPATVDDVGPLPCRPGVLRPRSAAPVKRESSPELLAAEREVALLRGVSSRYQRIADDAVAAAFRRERERVRARFLAKIQAVESGEREKRTAAIAALRDHLARRAAGGDLAVPAPPAVVAEVRFRVAELEFEDATDRWVVAMRAWEAAASQTPADSALPPQPRPEYRRAIAAYRDLVAPGGGEAAPPARRDGALYMIAYCLGEMGEDKAARDAWAALAAVPQSPYAAEAWLRIGEHHFDRGELREAIAAYEKASADRASEFFDGALYKLAWSHYRSAGPENRNAWASSAQVFARLVDEAPASELRPEALQYLALIYADHGGLPAVKAAVSDRPWGTEVIRALAQVWFEQRNWNDAAEAYGIAFEATPASDDAPMLLHRRGQALAAAKRADEAADARERLHREFGPGSKWAEARGNGGDAYVKAAALAEPALLYAAIHRHRAAQDTGVEATYASAAELYDEYLESYPGRAAAYDLAFYRGECLYFAGRFERAAGAYAQVLEFTDDDRWHAEAAFSRVKAIEALLGPALPSGSDPDPTAASRPLSPMEKQLVDAAEQFTCVAPTDWRVPEALYRAAQVYYAGRRLSAARDRAEAVVEAAPKDDLAAYAAALVVDAWRLEGSWGEVRASARRLAALSPGRLPEVRDSTRESLNRIALEAGFNVARGLERNGDHENAAAAFAALAAERADWESADKALFAAGEAWERAGRASEAAAAFGLVATRHPTSSLAQPAAFRRAANLERTLEVEAAAKAYADYANKYPFHGDAVAALWNAALLWEAAGKPGEAALVYERYAGLATGERDAADRMTARFRAADAWFAAGKHANAARAFDALAADPGVPKARTVEALAGLARAQRARKFPADVETARALEEQMFLLKNGEATPASSRAAADAGLDGAEPLWEQLSKVALRPPVAKLKGALRARSEMLRKAQESWLVVAALGDAEAATEAFHRIGESYLSFAQAAAAFEPPAGEEDVYAPLLAPFDAPMRERAIAAFDAGVRAADTARIETTWTRASRDALAMLDPAGHPRRREIVLPAIEDDVWAVPSMIVPPGSLVAGASLDSAAIASADAARGAALAEGVRAFARARAAGDRAGLVAAEKILADAVTGLAGDPDAALRATAWTDLGVAREALGDVAGAAVAWRAALDADGERREATEGLVAALARSGNAGEAISQASAWLRRHPGDARVRANLAGALRVSGDAPAALAMALQALSSDARETVAQRAAVACAFAAKREPLALFAARQGAVLRPEDPAAALTLGLALRRATAARVRGRALGRETLVRAAAKWPDDARIALAAGIAVLADGDAEASLPLLARAASRATEPAAALALAQARRATADANGAAKAAEQAFAVAPTEPLVLRAAGLARAEAGDLAGAGEAFRAYLRLTEGKREANDPVEEWLREVRTREEGKTP